MQRVRASHREVGRGCEREERKDGISHETRLFAAAAARTANTFTDLLHHALTLLSPFASPPPRPIPRVKVRAIRDVGLLRGGEEQAGDPSTSTFTADDGSIFMRPELTDRGRGSGWRASCGALRRHEIVANCCKNSNLILHDGRARGQMHGRGINDLPHHDAPLK